MANVIDYIYVGQEALSLRLDTNIDLSGGSDFKIKYTKPDGTSGSWTATVYNTTYLKKDFIDDQDELDQNGVWIFWTSAVMGDGRYIPGRPVQYYVDTEGEL